MSPSFFGRPKLLGFMDGMDLKDSCSGLYKAGIVGDNAPRALFSSLVRRPMMLGIMAVMDQNDSCSGLYKAGIVGDNAPRALFSSLVGRPMMFGIMAVMDQKDSCDMVPMFQTAETVESPSRSSTSLSYCSDSSPWSRLFSAS